MECVIFIGIQATGKSTFYKERFFHTHMRINLDMVRSLHREAQFFQTCLDTTMRCVIDNTNPTVADRARYIEPAKARNFRIIGYYFESVVADALERNAQRTGKQRIRDVGIFSTAKQLTVPTYAEGFDELYYVRLAEASFTINEWNEDLP